MALNIPSGFMCISQDFSMDADLCRSEQDDLEMVCQENAVAQNDT